LDPRKLPISIIAAASIVILTGILQQRELIRLKRQVSLLEEEASRAGIPDQPQILPITTVNPPVVEMARIQVQNDSEAVGSNSVKQKAAKLIAEAERLVNRGSQAEASMKLASRLYLASAALLEEILTQLNSSELAEPPKQMAWQMILKQLAKREPAEAMRFALEASGRPEWLFPAMGARLIA